jgi:nicotinamide N-methyltransferase
MEGDRTPEFAPADDPEDFLSDSLETLYNYKPITLTTSGAPFTYTIEPDAQQCASGQKPVVISLRTPDTAATNWALHASSIWRSSIYLCDHISDLRLRDHIRSKAQAGSEANGPLRVLELGASAGLPSIAIAALYPDVQITVSDYPDEALIATLDKNVRRNGVENRCRAVPFAWGTEPRLVLFDVDTHKFDVVIAADTLWNPDLHDIFTHAIVTTLAQTPAARAYLVVGLHTGRYTIESFMRRIQDSPLELETVSEKEVDAPIEREWATHREGEDDGERRRWVVWMTLKWAA